MMRKRNISYLFDTVFWYLIYFLPVLLYMIYTINATRIVGDDGALIMSFSEYLTFNGLGIVSNNVVFTTLSDLFGLSGSLPLLPDFAFEVLAWFVSMVILHVVVDFILLIPRLAHGLMGKLQKVVGDD